MEGQQAMAEQFEQLRPHMQGVAYRMLGSVSDAQDAVQECWLRLAGHAPTLIHDLRGWLTVAVGRICLDMLRKRQTRREEFLGARLPEPLLSEDNGPEDTTVMADSIGSALLVVLGTLTPAERLAFVLHDVFAVSFDEIAGILGRSPVAVRQLASRARRRVRHETPRAEADLATQRQVVSAFLAAARAGDFTALLAVLHEDVVFRADLGAGKPAAAAVAGAEAVVRHVLSTAPRFGSFARFALVNGGIGLVAGTLTEPLAALSFTISDSRILALDLVADVDAWNRRL